MSNDKPNRADDEPSEDRGDAFSRQAEEASPSLLVEFKDFLLDNKKWWLTPIVLVLLLMGLLVILGGSSAAPFIYTLF